MSQAKPESGDSSILPTVPFTPAFGSAAFDALDDISVDGPSLTRLLESLDAPRPERGDARPMWLRDLTDCVAGLFEPLSQTGRVGFQCRPDGGRWLLEAYLSVAEHVGGRLDGHIEPVNFRFDVAALFRCFERVTDCTWSVFPEPSSVSDGETDRGDIPDGLASLSIEGLVSDGAGRSETVAIQVYSVPPEEAEVGLKLFAGGDAVPV